MNFLKILTQYPATSYPTDILCTFFGRKRRREVSSFPMGLEWDFGSKVLYKFMVTLSSN